MGMPKGKAHHYLKALVMAGTATVRGKAVRGDPFVYAAVERTVDLSPERRSR